MVPKKLFVRIATMNTGIADQRYMLSNESENSPLLMNKDGASKALKIAAGT